jgi:hypothetical protein
MVDLNLNTDSETVLSLLPTLTVSSQREVPFGRREAPTETQTTPQGTWVGLELSAPEKDRSWGKPHCAKTHHSGNTARAHLHQCKLTVVFRAEHRSLSCMHMNSNQTFLLMPSMLFLHTMTQRSVP